MPLKGVRHVKAKTSSKLLQAFPGASSFSLQVVHHVAPSISNTALHSIPPCLSLTTKNDFVILCVDQAMKYIKFGINILGHLVRERERKVEQKHMWLRHFSGGQIEIELQLCLLVHMKIPSFTSTRICCSSCQIHIKLLILHQKYIIKI